MKVNVSDINNRLGKVDCFLVSTGFEERSKTLLSVLNSSKIENGIIFHLEDNYDEANTNLEIIKEKLIKKEIIKYPKNDSFTTFYIFYEKLIKTFSSVKKKEKLNVVIDATGFSREILLILFKVLIRESFISKLNLTFVHTPAEKYSDDNGLWLTKGVREIRPIFGYSGNMYPSKKLLLVVFNGFEDERTEIIIETFEPHKLVLANPSRSGSINEELKVIVDKKYLRLKNKFNSILIDEIEFSCIELDSTIKQVEEIYKKYNLNYNIAIAPLNNKTSTIAVALAAIRNPEIQVCYASANQYNIHKKINPCEYFLVFDY